jgi:hypothetical protein
MSNKLTETEKLIMINALDLAEDKLKGIYQYDYLKRKVISIKSKLTNTQ